MENAYSFPVCDLPLSNQGLVLVRGLNVDDGGYLGAGKSSLFNGFSRIQLGKSGKNDKVDEIIFDQVGKDLVKTLSLKKDGHPYEIRQYRKHHYHGTKVEFVDLKTGEDLLPDEARKHPHNWIRTFLGIDETSFFHLVYLTQDFHNALLHGKEADRRQKMTSMFDLDIFDLLLAQTKIKIRLLETKIGKVEVYQEQITDTNKELKKLGSIKQLKSRWKKSRKKTEAYQAGWFVSNKELETLQDLANKLKLKFNAQTELTKLWDVSPELRSVFKTVDALSTKEVRKLQRRFEKVTKRLARLESKAEQGRRRAIIKKHLANVVSSLKTIGEDVEGAEAEAADLKSRIHYLTTVELKSSESRDSILHQLRKLPKPPKDTERTKAEYHTIETEVATLESQIKRLKEQVNSGVCNECGRPLRWSEEEYQSKKVQLSTSRSKLRETRDKLFSLKDAVAVINSHEQLNQKLDALPTTRSVNQINKELSGLRSRETELNGALELLRQRTTLQTQLDSLPAVDSEKLDSTISVLSKKQRQYKKALKTAQRIAELKKQVETLPDGNRKEVLNNVSVLRQDVRSLGSKIKKWSKRASKYEMRIGQATSLKEKISELQNRIDKTKKAKRQLDSYVALKEAFGPKGIKQERFQTILEEAVSTTIPTYTSILWPNKKVRLHLEATEGLQFSLKRTDKKKLTKSNLLSGGEAHKAGLAFLLGLRDLKELYTQSRFNVLVIDEPFGNLDPQGEEALLSILEVLKERFDSIFVVSHRPEVIHSSVWDQTWWVIRERNASRLWMEEPPSKYVKLASSFSLAEGAT